MELLQFRYEELEIDEYLEELREETEDWIVKLDKTQPLYILYGCNIVKERSTMRLVAATTDEEMLKVIIGSQILLGVMDYRGFSNMKGFQQFRAACRNGDERYDDLSYGFVEQTENLLLPDCAKEPLYARAYKYLNMLDREFDEIRNGTLETLPGERKHQILSKALEWAAAHYDGWELYRHLKDHLGMEDQEISRAGFELDEFYEDEAPEDEADYEPEDDYEEDCDEEL